MVTKEEKEEVEKVVKKAYADGFFAGYAEGGRERLARLKKFVALEEDFWQSHVKNLVDIPKKKGGD